MNPWIAEQTNREHVTELRSMSRPFAVSLFGRRGGRRWIARAQRNRA